MPLKERTGWQDLRWHVASTQPHREQMAVEHLDRQGFTTACPWLWKNVKQGRKTVRRRAAAFPGYVFVAVDPGSTRWRAINGTRGVRSLITDGEGPVPVRLQIIETLFASMDSDGFIQFARGMRAGDPARLVAGPFADKLGVIESLDASGRARLLMTLMGREMRVQVAVGDLAPAVDGHVALAV